MAFGVKLTLPSWLSTASPPAPLVTLAIVSLSPSASTSFARSCSAQNVTGVSSLASNRSATATGASFTGETSILTVEAADSVSPSLTV